MSRLEQISPEEMPKVIQIASQLYEQDQTKAAEAQERQAYVDAAQEVDLPKEYLERAAAELQVRQIAQVSQQAGKIRQRRRVRNGVLATLGTVVALGGLWQITHRPPPAPSVYHFTAQQWKLDVNPETKANVTFQNVDGRQNVAMIHVDRFAVRAADGQYFVNLDAAETPPTLSGYKTASFFVKGNGLNTIRLYLENGPGERWRSPAIPITGDWQRQMVDMKQFDHQIRLSNNNSWQRAGTQLPDHVDRLSFKVGAYMNDVTAQGDVALDDLEFK